MATKKFDLSVILRLIDKASGPAKKFQGVMVGVGQNLAKFGKYAGAAAIVGAGAFTVMATRTAIASESAFTGVKKTVNATEEEYKQLKKNLEKLTLRIPLDPTEMFAIAEAAGQLGVEKGAIIEFTKTMADLGVTTDLSATEAAFSLAQFTAVSKLPQKEVSRLGSSIVELGNNMATTESRIVEMGLRLVGAGKQIGLTDPQIMGIAAGLSSVGIQAEAGGSAFSQVMKKIGKEVGSGSQKMALFAKVAGVSTADFEKAWKTDAGGALISFVEGIGRVGKEGKNVNVLLDALGFEGIRISDALLRAAGSGDDFRNAMNLSTDAFADNTALTKEANLRYSTMDSKIKTVQNRLSLLSSAFGTTLFPILDSILEKMTPVIENMTQWIVDNPRLIQEKWAGIKQFFSDIWTDGILKPIAAATKAWNEFSSLFILPEGSKGGILSKQPFLGGPPGAQFGGGGVEAAPLITKEQLAGFGFSILEKLKTVNIEASRAGEFGPGGVQTQVLLTVSAEEGTRVKRTEIKKGNTGVTVETGQTIPAIGFR